MKNLYNDLASVYEAMYQTFIDYEEEYRFYSEIIKKYTKKNILEIGSGTGNLASHFMQSGCGYTGLDVSKEMIAIAQKKTPEAAFLEGDMRDFKLKKAVESTIITGRTISYLLQNKEVHATFGKVYENLEKGGIFAFDFIDASRFISEISEGKNIIHEASYEKVDYLRKSVWKLNLEYGMDFHWASIYYKKNQDGLEEIGQDTSIVRTFTKEEIELLLTINNFTVKEIIDKKSYAFPTYVIVAQKA